jgi:hypothetical protein
LLPWNIREKFVRLIWESLERRDYGMSLDAMRGTLLDYANENNLPVSPQMVQKLLYTLNFARCFNSHKNASTGYSIPIPLEIYSPVYPVFGVDEAINQLHRRYLEILAGDVAVLDPDAAFDLLYGNEITDEQEREERRQDLDEMCCAIKPMGAVGQALLTASRQR